MTSIGASPRPRWRLTAISEQVITMNSVRRAARALKRINDEQLLAWEAFWRASRFPVDRADGSYQAR
jgi:hypothetical protein